MRRCPNVGSHVGSLRFDSLTDLQRIGSRYLLFGWSNGGERQGTKRAMIGSDLRDGQMWLQSDGFLSPEPGFCPSLDRLASSRTEPLRYGGTTGARVPGGFRSYRT